ncbi:DUF3180 domain-containing protein [Leucobacter sp. UT-8R-CII-1-4]|uniref:DUF3180 domain-containing protein n=1 Tax=Leucobacter sp. UT-8R-CII-1-4 TaxID=3040075 RepID=UPI0024A7B5A2|nr:DUF3180 domain-containing protein [Leucobacter sp. UT-8R-CII-1-4]MDI6022465.1 DUF3180 domain-containing protein [Leucobacter sp. UT-8R-CII-1-4]
MQRTSPLTVATFGVVGIGIGLLLQLVRSNAGMAPLVPPISLALTELVLGGVLVTLGISLRRAVTNKSGKAVNPFHAVRLLAGARAGQFVGALIGGFGAGLALQLLSRSVMPPAASWVPMLCVFGGGVALVVCGVIAESLCRVPPGADDADGPRTDGTEAEPGAA